MACDSLNGSKYFCIDFLEATTRKNFLFNLKIMQVFLLFKTKIVSELGLAQPQLVSLYIDFILNFSMHVFQLQYAHQMQNRFSRNFEPSVLLYQSPTQFFNLVVVQSHIKQFIAGYCFIGVNQAVVCREIGLLWGLYLVQGFTALFVKQVTQQHIRIKDNILMNVINKKVFTQPKFWKVNNSKEVLGSCLASKDSKLEFKNLSYHSKHFYQSLSF